MAVAEMSHVTFLGLTAERDRLLNALQRTGAAQVFACAEREDVPFLSLPATDTARTADRVSRDLDFLLSLIYEAPKEMRAGLPKDGFGVTLDEFYAVADRKEEIDCALARAESLAERQTSLRADISRIQQERKNYEPYLSVGSPFSAFVDTAKTCVYLGLLPSDKVAAALADLSAIPTLVTHQFGSASTGVVVGLVFFHTYKAEVDALLSAVGFVRAPYRDECTAEAKVASLDEAADEAQRALSALAEEACSYMDDVRLLRLYADYLTFVSEKETASEGMLATTSTFVMEAYVPTEAVERVAESAQAATSAVFVEASPIPRNEYAPTLMKNNKVVSNFEAVTNMYSAPAYGALDPNPVMSFFFSLFMGVIMADAVYGLFMLIGGLVVASKRRPGTGLYRMAKVFALGGIFAICFGVLFDSWFGFDLLRTVAGAKPFHIGAFDGTYAEFYAKYLDAIGAPTTIMGISVPSILLWCLGLGVVQIAAGLFLKAVQHFRRHEILDGLFGGVVWGLGMLSFAVWVFAMASERVTFDNIAMYVTLGFIGVGVLTSGITAKGFGKITKIGGAAYGLINYMSDILSYARLYGLMLSGAQIAAIFTKTLAIETLFPKGPVGVIFGVLIIVVGNLFNIAMSLLGAYIHDSRLQYVEFFGRFFEGEGELFTPIGSTHEHVYFAGGKEQ